MSLKAYEPKKTIDGHMKQTILAQSEAETDKKFKTTDSMELKAYEPTKVQKGDKNQVILAETTKKEKVTHHQHTGMKWGPTMHSII